MKIRTDFATNSSSSAFIVQISYTLTDGREITYSETGYDAEGEPVVGELYLYASPRQLGLCDSIEDMIKLLKSSVSDIDILIHDDEDIKLLFDKDGPKLLFDKDDPEVNEILKGERIKNAEYGMRRYYKSEKEAHAKAQEFVQQLNAIEKMEQIKQITISGHEEYQSGWYYEEVYTYDLETGDYTCQVDGELVEHDGSSGGELHFDDREYAEIVEKPFDFDEEDE